MLYNCFLLLIIPIIIFGLFQIVYLLIEFYYFNTFSYFNFSINNKNYKVLKDKDNFENAANILYKIDNNIMILINYITKKYQDNKTNLPIKKYKIIKQIIYKTQKNYKSHSLKENFPSVPGRDVSYNINKGDHISLCLRDFYNPNSFHEFNDIMFVAIHELAHSCTISFDHTDEFWYNFRFLLENAIEAQIYINKNYNQNPVNYCSMEITYNPIFDDNYSDNVYLLKK